MNAMNSKEIDGNNMNDDSKVEPKSHKQTPGELLFDSILLFTFPC